MKMTPNQTIAETSQAVRNLVETARRGGTADYYAGKRRHVRYAELIPLDASENARGATTTWPITMENVSLGGIAFWSKRALRPGSYIRIREFTSDGTGEWTTLKVVYSIVGIRGFLIGAAIQSG
jgi:hypothetical protein